MRVNWSNVPDNQDYSPLMPGKYLVEIDAVLDKTTRAGAPMWGLVLKVVEGPREGRKIFDNIVWSDDGLKRAKLIFKRLGLIDENTQECEIEKSDLLGRLCMVTVEASSYYSTKHDREVQTNAVTFDGYEPFEGQADEQAKGNIPF